MEQANNFDKDVEFEDLNLHEFKIDTKENNIIYDPLLLFFQELELTMKILPGEIWGLTNYLDLESYVFKKGVSKFQIKNEILSYVATNCQHSTQFNYNVNVSFPTIDNKTIILIEFIINCTDYEGFNQEYLQKFVVGY